MREEDVEAAEAEELMEALLKDVESGHMVRKILLFKLLIYLISSFCIRKELNHYKRLSNEENTRKSALSD
jgi:hypothetical protein